MNLFSLLDLSEGDFPEVNFLLGFLHFHGLGMQKDYAKARRYFALAAEHGLTSAEYSLGIMAQRGLDMPSDLDLAIRHLSSAADRGHAPALLQLALIYETKGSKADLTTAFECYLRAARLGVAVAATRVAYCYEEGEGVLRDTNLSLDWYSKAAALGDATAHLRLSDIFREGLLGVKIDNALADSWRDRGEQLEHTAQQEEIRRYREAALNGHKGAQRILADIYRCGLNGVEVDLVKSTYWLKQSEAVLSDSNH